MVDLQVIEIRDLLRVSSVEHVPGLAVPTVQLTGEDFLHVQDVFLNETQCPDVVVLSATSLLAQLPESVVDRQIVSVVVSSTRLTRTARSTIAFRVADSPGTVDGLTRLIQTFVKLVLTTPGTDIFSRKVGGGLLGVVGKQTADSTAQMLSADFSLAVTRARQQLMTLQAANPKLSLSERLAYATVVGIHYDPSDLSMVGRVALGNQTGRGSVVGMGL